MRSRCRRSIITASTPSSAESKSSGTTQSASVASSGSSEAGPNTRISPVPSVRKARRSLRATRECFTSPTISTFSPEKSVPLAWRRVSMSSRPWVGWWLRPSPAFTSAVPGAAAAASAATAPSSRWRTTKPRTPIASMLRRVSSAVSPLLVDEAETSNARVSAPSRCAASRKLERVRVDGSKNSVHTAVPASALRNAVPPRASAASCCARSSRRSMAARGKPSMANRWRRRPSASSCSVMWVRPWDWREGNARARRRYTGVASCGAASQRSTITAAATASSAAASRRRRRPSARSAAKRCAASIELARSSTITTGNA